MKRAWTLRIHPWVFWPGDLTPGQVTINGRQSNLPIRKLPRAHAAMPFGDITGAPDGDVYELTLPDMKASKSIQVNITFQ